MKKTILLVLLVILAPMPRGAISQDVDTMPPYVISTYPHNGQAGVPTNARIHVTFSEEMDDGTITSDTINIKVALGDEEMYGLVSYSNRSATFVPFDHFIGMSSYTIIVSDDVRDLNGNSMGRTYTATFETTGTE